MRSSVIPCWVMLFHAWIQPPHGFANALFRSGNWMVCSPNVFQIPIVYRPSAMALLMLGTSQRMPLWLIDSVPLYQPTARSTSPSEPASAPPPITATSVAASSNPLTIRMTSSPPLDDGACTRRFVSQMIDDLRRRQLDEPRAPHVLDGDEAYAPAGHLLVGPHRDRELRPPKLVRQLGRQPRAPEHVLHAPHQRGRAESERPRDAARGDEADRDRLAVQEPAIVGERLDGVPDRVPEVEHGACPGLLALVGGHDGRLLARARGNDADQHVGLEREQLVETRLQLREEPGVADQAVLHDLRETRHVLAPRQRTQHVDVGQNRARLVDRKSTRLNSSH